MVRDARKSPGQRHSPLVVLVILVYVVFLATAVASIAVFFPQASLPSRLRLAAPTVTEPSAAPGVETRASWVQRTWADVSSRIASIRLPDVGAALRRWAAAVGGVFRSVRLPDVSAMLRRLGIGRQPPEALPPTPPPEAAAGPPAAPQGVPSEPAAGAGPRAPEPAAGTTPRAPEAAPAGALPSEAARAELARLEALRADLERTASELQSTSDRLAGLLRGGPTPAGATALREAYEARRAEPGAAVHGAAPAPAAGGPSLEEVVRRYNPVITERALAGALARKVDRSLFGADVTAPYRELLEREGIVSAAQYEQLRQRALELDALAGRLLQVPYTNSVPPALERIRAAGQTLAREYGRIWTELAARLAQRDARIASLESRLGQFELALERLSRSTREGGYVLDARDPQAVLIYVSPIHDPKVGDTVYVFREEDELLATLRITAVGEVVQARVVEAGPTPMAAFDRILLATAEGVRG